VNPKAKLILLVEDNPDDAELTLLALQENGVLNEVIWVKDGVEALDFLFRTGAYAERDPKELPQLVLLDLKMPRMDGIEVLRRIRSEPSTRLLPVVILTTSAEDSDRLNGYLLGANSYIRKPVDFEQFARAVKQLKLYWLVLNEAPPPSE
jgi:two-component system response regulator